MIHRPIPGFQYHPPILTRCRNPQIIGIIGHVNQWGLDSDGAEALHAQVYLPVAQIPARTPGGGWALTFSFAGTAGGSNLAAACVAACSSSILIGIRSEENEKSWAIAAPRQVVIRQPSAGE